MPGNTSTGAGANRPKGFGLTAELQRKKEAKFDAELVEEVFEWMRAVFMEEEGGPDQASADLLPERIENAQDVHKALKNGQLLCKLVNRIQAGSVKKVNTMNQTFKMMENINNFLVACEKFGCKKIDLFQSVDLYEGQNIPQVINGIIALGRKIQGVYSGPALGPAESTENKRQFTEEQMRASDGIIGLQAGSNKGASQAGQNFGKTRAIID